MIVLKLGTTGATVVTLQKALTAAGFAVAADGIFGTLTEIQVKAFQAGKDLTVDGIVGGATWAALGVKTSTTLLKGVDVSRYETSFNFAKGVADGVVFMMTKASEGVGIDKTDISECAKAKAAGVKFRGVYHFHHTSISTAAQLATYMAQYRICDQNMAPILDLEETSVNGHTYLAVKESALAMLQGMEAASGKVPILYIDMNMLNLTGINKDARFNKYPRWIALYSASEPKVNWTFWQFSDKGEQGADTDWFHGDLADLQAFVQA